MLVAKLFCRITSSTYSIWLYTSCKLLTITSSKASVSKHSNGRHQCIQTNVAVVINAATLFSTKVDKKIRKKSPLCDK